MPRPERSQATPLALIGKSRGVLGLLGGLLGVMALPSIHQPYPRDPGLPDLLPGGQGTV